MDTQQRLSRLFGAIMAANVLLWIHSEHDGLRAIAWLCLVTFFYHIGGRKEL